MIVAERKLVTRRGGRQRARRHPCASLAATDRGLAKSITDLAEQEHVTDA
ncbi:MAG: hypothetical protein ACREJ0_29595 [Geminicoccaceae bacterium]